MLKECLVEVVGVEVVGAVVAVRGKPIYFIIFIFQNNSSGKQTAEAISAEVAVRREVTVQPNNSNHS